MLLWYSWGITGISALPSLFPHSQGPFSRRGICSNSHLLHSHAGGPPQDTCLYTGVAAAADRWNGEQLHVRHLIRHLALDPEYCTHWVNDIKNPSSSVH